MSQSRAFRFLIVLAAYGLWAASGRAATLTVTNTLDKGAGSLRSAISHAKDGDTINFASSVVGQITLKSGALVIGSRIDIEGPGANLLAVSGNDSSRVFEPKEGLIIRLAGLTITHGRAGGGNGGGAILNVSGTLVLENAIFSDNVAGPGSSGNFTPGGAIANLKGGTIIASDTSFLRNQALAKDGNFGAEGGAICNYHADLIVTRCTFSGNRAVGGYGGKANGVNNFLNIAIGGAIFSGHGTSLLKIKDSIFEGNQAIGGDGASGGSNQGDYILGIAVGGAIASHDVTVLEVDGSRFSYNQAVGGSNSIGSTVGARGRLGNATGGAIHHQGTGVVTNSTFDHNAALGGSGNRSDAGAFLIGQGRGGAIENAVLFGGAGELRMRGVTFLANLALGGDFNSGIPSAGVGIGGGLLTSLGGTSTLVSCTFEGNQAIGGLGHGSSSDGLGGGIANPASTSSLLGCSLTGNQATGGAAVANGSAGLGQGGGAYLTDDGVACADSATIISDNSASSSDGDIFGALGVCGP